MDKIRKTVLGLFLLPALAGIFLLTVSRAIDRGMNHDEQQFIAPAILWQQDALQPYRDFPLFHLPNTIYLYGLVSTLTPYKLLSMRLVSGVAAGLFVSSALAFGLWTTRRRPLYEQLVTSLAIALLLLCSPLFISETGLIWNHDVPVLLTFLGIISLFVAFSSSRPRGLFFLAGLLISLATGARLTIAPLALPFLLTPWLSDEWSHTQKVRYTLSLAVGALLGAIPVFVSFIHSPEGFIFGNFEAPRLSLLDPENLRVRKTATLWRKIRFLGKEVLLTNPALVIAAGWASVRLYKSAPLKRNPSAVLIYLLFGFALLGCFAPSRYQYQHFSILLPILAAAVALGASKGEKFPPTVLILGILGVFSGLLCEHVKREPAYVTYGKSLADVLNQRMTQPIELHRDSQHLKALVPVGKVLTLSPAVCSEGSIAIYPELSIGPFAWRNARFVAAERRFDLRVLSPEDLPKRLANDPPAAILLGFEPKALEAPLLEYAHAHGYQRTEWRGEGELYLQNR